MSKKIKDQEVLLVKDQKDDSLRAVIFVTLFFSVVTFAPI